MTEEELALAIKEANEKDEYNREHLRWIKLTSAQRKRFLRECVNLALYPETV